jgi:ABC-2 type transport system permease protein
MRWRPIVAIVRKDLTAVIRNRGVRVPLLVTPVLVLGVLPLVLVAGADMLVTGTDVPLEFVAGDPLDDAGDGAATDTDVAAMDPLARLVVFVLEAFVAPLFLLVPLVVATVIAADSFAGERERGTLEALLHTPTTDRELLTAKFLASWVPAVAVSLISFALYSVLANLLAWPTVGRVFFPTPTWLVLAFWVSPALAAFGLSIMVIASSRVHSLQAAHQIGSLLVLPIVVLVIAQISGLMRLQVSWVALSGLALWVTSALIVTLGARSLRRERLAQRL